MKRRAPCTTHGIPCRMGSHEWAALPSSLRCCAAAARATAPRSTSATLACSLAHSSTASSRSSDQLAPAHRTAKLLKFHAAQKPRRAGAAPARAERAGGGKWRGAGRAPPPAGGRCRGLLCVATDCERDSSVSSLRTCGHTYICVYMRTCGRIARRAEAPADAARHRTPATPQRHRVPPRGGGRGPIHPSIHPSDRPRAHSRAGRRRS